LLVTVVIISAVLVAAVVMMLAFVWAVAHNMRQGEAVYNRTAERLSGLRLHKALQRFGVDPVGYLHRERAVDMERRMRRCESCAATVQCEAYLGQNQPIEQFAFCPNYHELWEHQLSQPRI
jgi:hypothetical protein